MHWSGGRCSADAQPESSTERAGGHSSVRLQNSLTNPNTRPPPHASVIIPIRLTNSPITAGSNINRTRFNVDGSGSVVIGARRKRTPQKQPAKKPTSDPRGDLTIFGTGDIRYGSRWHNEDYRDYSANELSHGLTFEPERNRAAHIVENAVLIYC